MRRPIPLRESARQAGKTWTIRCKTTNSHHRYIIRRAWDSEETEASESMLIPELKRKSQIDLHNKKGRLYAFNTL